MKWMLSLIEVWKSMILFNQSYPILPHTGNDEDDWRVESGCCFSFGNLKKWKNSNKFIDWKTVYIKNGRVSRRFNALPHIIIIYQFWQLSEMQQLRWRNETENVLVRLFVLGTQNILVFSKYDHYSLERE